ncbi:MAG: DUF4340 domain-containing protein [Candidatus Omnitrophota bacterium]|nr:DUF4340 domain-containing protein [Candidatus Omnitrophota bacterium]
MKSSVTVIFLLLFVVVAGFYVYLMPSENAPPPPEVVRALRLLPLEAGDEIVLIEIIDAEEGKSIMLENNEGTWELTKPVRDTADILMAEGLEKVLALSSKARRLVPDKEWSEYGLLNPKVKIGIETRKKRERRFLYFGDAAPIGDFVFARWEGEKEYFLLNADLMRAFDRSVYSLREKRIFRTLRKDIEKIRIQGLDVDYEFVNNEQGWVWSEPIDLLGEELTKRQVDELLSQIRELYVKDFLDGESRAKEELGFKLGSSAVRIWGHPETGSEILYLGDEVPEKDAYYGLRSGESRYFVVARGNIRSLLEIIETFVIRTREGSGVVL